jgi:transcriptional regulator with XRE-family HTH domain
VKQPQVARLESGLVTPSIDTLVRISERLGIEFTVEIRPEGLAVRYKLPD